MDLGAKLIDRSKEIEKEFNNKMNLALQAVGGQAENYAKALTPVGTPESTGIPGYIGGTLKNSISHAVQDNVAYIGTNVEYAPYVEFGDSMNHLTGQAHFLRDAATTHGTEYKELMEKVLKQ